MVTVLWVGDPGFNYWQGYKISLFSKVPVLGMEPTQPPVQWVVGSLYPGVKQLGHEVRCCPSYSATVKNDWRCTSTATHCLETSSYSCIAFMYTAQWVESL